MEGARGWEWEWEWEWEAGLVVIGRERVGRIPWWLATERALAPGRDAKKSGGGGVGKGAGVTRGAMLDRGRKKGKERARGDSGVEQEERG
ncbi:hypothetical protein HETIRDRAFT_451054 [Heterobasidion irregulare TC 32-1]|uniref:Uncharacterized protein n=1 Tax=Heterobasidion irregulare (strain TC 32-1) TaxID=747525 RepID=W4KCI1_HETIT|nr:uncharacterized protein HETIRDRAFT_451054 [Heterobasidion irregulare TC 32-1]ETW83483.1 hypothetical protein HETIRDRAFT_451054 [Heterobasidion irregulare TC 32-1]